jgi:hypothetical protein
VECERVRQLLYLGQRRLKVCLEPFAGDLHTRID